MRHKWWVKREILPLFPEGKDLEVRIDEGYPKRVRVGDELDICETYLRRVSAIRRYEHFGAMIAKENFLRIHPRVVDKEHILRVLREIYGPEREQKGVLVFELIQLNGHSPRT